MRKFAKKTFVLGGLAALGLASVASAAVQEGMAREATVRYSESSLATDEGTRDLYIRLAHAAEKVCPIEPTYSQLRTTGTAACRQKALSAAVAKVHNQRLAALHAATWKSG